MSPKSFLTLAGVAAVSLVLALGAVVSRDLPATESKADAPLFPDLMDRANEVGTVKVQTPEATFTVVARDGGWALVEKSGYPVPPERVRDLVLGLANLRLVEAKTARLERLARLELEPPDAKDAKSRLVELLDREGKPLAAAVVGKTQYGLYGGGRAGVYVRRAGEDQAWLAAGSVELPSDALDLVRREILDLPQAEIREVILGFGSPSPVRLHRPDRATEKLTVEATPPEGRMFDQDKVDRVAGVLAALSMQDVKPAAEVPFPPDARRSRFVTFDGLAVEATVTKEGEGGDAAAWARFATAPVEAAPTSAGTPPANAQPPNETPAAKPPAERAAELNRRLEGWAFKLSPYLADRLGATLDGLLADPQGAS